jgi:3-phenylpropionate/cinnamic acid dioxygenase small subunit
MGDAESLAQLTSRVDRLDQIQSIQDSLYRYAHCIDYGLESEWVDCFTDDGRFVFGFRPGKSPFPGPEAEGGAVFAFQGRTELTRFIQGHSRAPETFHKHLMIQPRIDIQGNTAKVSSYFVLILENQDGSREVFTFGRYLDSMVRGSDGRWRFSERIAEVETCGPGSRLQRVAQAQANAGSSPCMSPL